MDLNQFIEWQAAEPGRSVSIDIRPKIYPHEKENEVQIWVYSTKYLIGQFVENVSEIDLVAKKNANDREKYLELKKKFEEEKNGSKN